MIDKQPPLFRLENVSLKISGKLLLENISLDISQGDFMLITGPSGSGKTTLLRMLNGLHSPTSGNVHYNGKPILNENLAQTRQEIGMVFQNLAVFMGSVRENLLLRQRWDASFLPSEKDTANALQNVDLAGDMLNADARSLSGGEKQRLALARVLLNNPKALLLDEPTANLDEALAAQILERISKLKHDLGLTVVLVSHQSSAYMEGISRNIQLDKGNITEH
ncbi:MAG: ABC transporter ATP-binding protein [Candidatus Marinimicrobia bacterium]|jgi:putative ABC transport system ATP-binding protein|nr:ABC transporter ATP-binding protein [Candidatus Neomarinimicrobiota bacterium]